MTAHDPEPINRREYETEYAAIDAERDAAAVRSRDRREDHSTNTVEDAAAWEQWRGRQFDDDNKPFPYEYAED